MKTAPSTGADQISWPASQVEMCDVAALIPYARNARTHDADQISALAKSIQEFGFTMPILRDESGTVLAGHARLAAAQQLNLKAVPVITAHGWSEAKKRGYVLLDNQMALRADWDPDLLKIELSDLQLADFDLDLLGFDDEMDEFLSDKADDPTWDDFTPTPGLSTTHPNTPQINPPVDPTTLQFQPSLTPTLETKQYTDADLNKEDNRLQKRFEQPRRDPYRVVCPHCAGEFFIDV